MAATCACCVFEQLTNSCRIVLLVWSGIRENIFPESLGASLTQVQEQASTGGVRLMEVAPQLTNSLKSIRDRRDTIFRKHGWSLRLNSAVDSEGRTILNVDAHHGDGKRFAVHADKKLTTFRGTAIGCSERVAMVGRVFRILTNLYKI